MVLFSFCGLCLFVNIVWQLTVPIMGIGNNDMLPRYPPPPPQGKDDPWLAQLCDTWPILKRLDETDKSIFRKSGFYWVDLVPDRLRVLVLHTNYWSSQNGHTADMDDPADGFSWLQNQLVRAQKEGVHVWLLGHAPPGVDHYSQHSTYHPQHAQKYFSLTGEFYVKKVIRASIFGHEHVIQERNASESNALLFLQGSVAPDKGNNPSFRILTVNGTDHTLLDLDDVFLDLGAQQNGWKSLYAGSSFARAYGLSVPFTLSNILDKAASTSGYLMRQYSNTPSLCVESDCSTRLVCDVAKISVDEYDFCLTTHETPDSSWRVAVTVIIVAVLLTILLMGALVGLRWWRNRRTSETSLSQTQRITAVDWGLDDPLPTDDEFDFNDEIVD